MNIVICKPYESFLSSVSGLNLSTLVKSPVNVAGRDVAARKKLGRWRCHDLVSLASGKFFVLAFTQSLAYF